MSIFVAFRTAAVAILRPKQVDSLQWSQHVFKPSIHVGPSRGLKVYAENQKKHLKNSKIQKIYTSVRLVDNETGRLSEFRDFQEILNSIDKETHFIELVSNDPDPIVKIFNKKEVYFKIQQSKAHAKVSAARNVQKEVQLTWGMAPGDLAHKMEKIKEELEKGRKVDLVYAPKKGQPFPRFEEMSERVDEVVNQLADISKEWKPREMSRSIAAVFLQGTADVVVPEAQPSQRDFMRLQRQQKRAQESKENRERAKEWNQKLDIHSDDTLNFQD